MVPSPTSQTTGKTEFSVVDSQQLRFSIVTPSYNQLNWLKLCVASVRDQVKERSESERQKAGSSDEISTEIFTQVSGAKAWPVLRIRCSKPQVSSTLCVEHIIQDSGTPGMEDFAREVGADFYRDGALVFSTRNSSTTARQYRISIYCETDTGMYDAINRGLRRTTGQICAYLNCDEQYLPDTLKHVAAVFEARKSLSLLFGDAVLANETGPVSYRKMILPKRENLKENSLNTLSCATFFRRVLIERGFLFDPQWKIIGDKAWVDSLIGSEIVMATYSKPLAVYFFTGNNLSASPKAAEEKAAWMKMRPAHPFYPARLLFRLKKLLVGAYWPRSVTISIYTPTSSTERVTMTNPQTRHRWPKSEVPMELQTS